MSVTGISSFITNLLPNFSSGALVSALITLVVAVVMCFFGYRLLKYIVAVFGFMFGVSLGQWICSLFNGGRVLNIIITLVIAIGLALVAFLLFKVGVFILIFGSVLVFFGAAALFTSVNMLIGVAVALVLAILGVVFIRPVSIFITGINGGLSIGDALTTLVLAKLLPGMAIVGAIIGLVLAILGIIYQFKTTKAEPRRRR
ncbi:MAG: hypothetical protein Q4B73_08055 [Lachnospiraceae bacterium]|nr:hypothetical protein [Lachnospiraceae bacterium]